MKLALSLTFNCLFGRIPVAVTRVLIDTASSHPDYFVRAQTGGTFLLDKNVRLVSDGVFVADQKVADLGGVVENIARADVVNVTLTPVEHHLNPWVKVGIGVGAVFLAYGFAHGCHCGWQ